MKCDFGVQFRSLRWIERGQLVSIIRFVSCFFSFLLDSFFFVSSTWNEIGVFVFYLSKEGWIMTIRSRPLVALHCALVSHPIRVHSYIHTYTLQYTHQFELIIIIKIKRRKNSVIGSDKKQKQQQQQQHCSPRLNPISWWTPSRVALQ